MNTEGENQSVCQKDGDVGEVVIDPSASFLYFHHVINGQGATLTSQFLGANISHTFHHDAAQELYTRAKIIGTLNRKTTGCLVLVKPAVKAQQPVLHDAITPSPPPTAKPRRFVLAWAESGHGCSGYGDSLTPSRTTLPNKLWTHRVSLVRRLLGLTMRHPFDGMSQRRDPLTCQDGIFLGSHVEVKLAVFGICTLLNAFGILNNMDRMSRTSLNKLRRARWEDGTRPKLEVYFSRKNCGPCGNLIRRLHHATGVEIKLCWRDRLVPKEYQHKKFEGNIGCRFSETAEADDLALGADFEDVDEEGNISLPGGSEDDLISVSSDETVIDLTGGDDYDGSGAEDAGGDFRDQRLDHYCNGLAYCVGQMQQNHEAARAATVGFAKDMKRHGAKMKRTSDAQIEKPLPATAEIEPPA